MDLVGLVPKTFLPECVIAAYYQSLDAAETDEMPSDPDEARWLCAIT